MVCVVDCLCVPKLLFLHLVVARLPVPAIAPLFRLAVSRRVLFSLLFVGWRVIRYVVLGGSIGCGAWHVWVCLGWLVLLWRRGVTCGVRCGDVCGVMCGVYLAFGALGLGGRRTYLMIGS